MQAKVNNHTTWAAAAAPQRYRWRRIVRERSKQALGAAAGLMLQAFPPQPAAVAGGGKLLNGEIAQHGYAAEFVRVCAGRVLPKLTVGHGCESGAPRHLERAPIVASSGTREMFDGGSNDGFDL